VATGIRSAKPGALDAKGDTQSALRATPLIADYLPAGGRFPAEQVIPYIVAQVIGAIVAALLLYAIDIHYPHGVR
jgi:hypothetical protein